jgi:predicted KAP-like P-loop ATPase
MFTPVYRPVQNGMIITDDVTPEPILDFENYSSTIVKMISQSYPKFSVGIYGEWGTGKTTLMKMVENKLKQNEDVLTVWFNAWRYEREDQFAIIALLKTVAYAMGKHSLYKELKPILLRAVKIFTKNFLSEVAAKYIGEKGVDDFRNKLLPKMDLLAEVDKDTIYFDGINKIEEDMRNILSKYQSTRVVVFIDDLDRCSPKKTLEVFESVKVFLGIDGFVYVLGLSHETISKLITAEYKEGGIKGEQYIKKIIQIPIIIPEWNTKDIGDLIDDFLKNNIINKEYQEVIRKNAVLISEVVENNPREVKRFINNYIVAYDIYYSNKKIDPTQLLLVQAINIRWNNFYRLIVRSSKEFREEIKKYVEMREDERIAKLESDKTEEGFSAEFRRILGDSKFEPELWNFLRIHYNNMLEIKEWEIYRRAAESVREIPTTPTTPTTTDWTTDVQIITEGGIE